MTTYFRKREVVDALKWTGDNSQEMQKFAGDHFNEDDCGYCDPCICEEKASILVREGHRWRNVYPGDYVVRYNSQSFSIQDGDVFERDYVEARAGE